MVTDISVEHKHKGWMTKTFKLKFSHVFYELLFSIKK